MKFLTKRLCLIACLGVVLLFGPSSVHAQSDDEDLPEEPSAMDADLDEADAGEDSMTDDADQAVETIAPTPGPASAPTEDASKSASVPGPLWESYDSENSASVAQEVTRGVRVEDIVEPPSDFRFAAFGKPDPFIPPLMARELSADVGTTVDPLEIPIVSPLQRLPLASLSVVGIWELATGERKAMIMGRDVSGAQQGIIVKNGDPVGNKGGKILSIADDFLTVREFTLAPDGTRQYDDQQMTMSGHQEEDVGGKIRFMPGQAETQIIMDDGSAATPGGTLLDINAKKGEGGKTAKLDPSLLKQAQRAPTGDMMPPMSGLDPDVEDGPGPAGVAPVAMPAAAAPSAPASVFVPPTPPPVAAPAVAPASSSAPPTPPKSSSGPIVLKP